MTLDPTEHPTTADPSFDRYARMVQRYLDVPVALVSLVEEGRQAFPGAAGLPEPWATRRETPLSHSFCQYVVQDETPLVIEDARTDERLRGNLAIEDLDVIAYAGWPLIDEQHRTIGSLCAIDSSPRRWTREDLDALADLADACSAELMYRRRQHQAEQQAAHARMMSQRSQVLLTLSEGLSVTRTLDDIAYAVEQVAVDSLGCLHAGIWLNTPERGRPDRLTYISDPTARWSSAARNAELPVDASNPIGEVLTMGRPQYFARKDDQNARYPNLDLRDQIGGARAFMPLGLGRVFGTLVLLWDEDREIAADERVTIATLASYTAQAVQRALLLREREESNLTLQSAMLTTLPRAEGLELTALYRPASSHDRVGGDWYDAVVTLGGEANLMIGDVMGHDIAAAAVMGELRSMLRALAWTHDDLPARNVARLDEAISSFGITRFASLVFARVGRPDGSGKRDLTWTNAGHLPPLLIHPDGSTEVLHDGGDCDVLLGVDPTSSRRDLTAQVHDGSTLLFYTDGLVERRGESIETGIERLRREAARQSRHRGADLLEEIVGGMVRGFHEDDIAVLAVRFT